MKLNKSCIRKVMMYIEDHCIYEDDRHGDMILHRVILPELLNAKELSKYEEADIRYSVVKLLEGNYIKARLIPENSGLNFDYVFITELTLCGHDLLDNIRPEPVWKETKNVLSKVGDFSLNIMSQVAGKIMVAYSQSMM